MAGHSSLIGSALALLLTAIAAAQGPVETQDYELDSGPQDNPGGSFTMVFSAEVSVPEAPWLRLHFTNTSLPEDSWLLLTSTEDAAWQRFDSNSLQDYANVSAVFNGDRVLVQLLAAPGTQANQVAVNRVEFGTGSYSPEDTICPPGDDRQLSSDPRVARGYLSGCTMWLVNEHTLVTAGHCIGWELPGVGPFTNLALFDVPLSNAEGGWRFPTPDHQYALDLWSLIRRDNGLGEDWAVVSTFRNSNHGRYPGQSQGSWFEIGTVPEASIGEESIRITGNGAVDQTLPATWSWAQKTQVGPGVGITPTTIRYRTDTTDGNSGSPVILERTGEVIGIHTIGGCSGDPGWNTGTRIDAPGLLEAIVAVSNSKVAGSATLLGQGCQGASRTPLLGASGIADIGRSVNVTVSWAPPNQLGVFALGFSDTEFQGLSLPLQLDVFGIEGCTLYTSAEAQLPVLTGLGFPSLPLELPGNPLLVGKDVYIQFIGLDPGAPNTLGAVASNAIHLHIGG